MPNLKFDELLGQYHRPANCNSLLAPKTNKTTWGQLKDSTRKTDIGMQKCQTLFLTAAYALLQASKTTIRETNTTLIHALVLILSGHREFSLKRRELLNPDLSEQKPNKQVSYWSVIEAGQLQNCLAEWKSITSDPFILQSITNCEIDFDDIPNPPNSMSCLHPEQKFLCNSNMSLMARLENFWTNKLFSCLRQKLDKLFPLSS